MGKWFIKVKKGSRYSNTSSILFRKCLGKSSIIIIPLLKTEKSGDELVGKEET